MKIILFFSILFASNLVFSKTKTDFDLKFQLTPYQNQKSIGCTYKIENELSQDWLVFCDQNKFRVHLWVSEYRGSTSPKQKFEILYWVTELNNSAPIYHTQTSWLKFKEITTAHSFELSQGVLDDTYALSVDVLF